MSFIPYKEQLLDPRWQKKRLEILQRDGFTCQYCYDTKSTLHVHHLVYETEYAWEAENDSLLTLCAKCHEKYTKINKILDANILNSLHKKLKDPFILKCADKLFKDFNNLNDLIYSLWEIRDMEDEILDALNGVESL